MTSPRATRIICSVLSVLIATIMGFLMLLAYVHLDFKDSFYVWIMMVPLVFNLIIAILFGGGCLSPINLSCCPIKAARKQDDDPTEILAVPGTSGCQRNSHPKSSTLRNGDSSSQSFFASGDSGYTVIPSQSETSKMEQTVLSESRDLYEVKHNPDGSAYLSAVLNPNPGEQKRGRKKSNPGVKYTKLTNDAQQASSTRVPADGARRSRAKRPKISEKAPLLESHKPISVLEDSKDYGAVNEVERNYPFPIYGIVPKVSGGIIEVDKDGNPLRTRSFEDHWFSQENFEKPDKTNSSWPDYKVPVYHFTPTKQNQGSSKPEILEIDMKGEETRVELDYPTADSLREVEKWIKINSAQKSTEGEDNQAESSQKSETGGRSKSKSRKRTADEAEPTTPDKELNKFCILGKGYFYATEAPDYLRVESSQSDEDKSLISSTDSVKTITNSPEKDSESSKP